MQKPFYGQLGEGAVKFCFFIEQGRAEGLTGIGEYNFRASFSNLTKQSRHGFFGANTLFSSPFMITLYKFLNILCKNIPSVASMKFSLIQYF